MKCPNNTCPTNMCLLVGSYWRRSTPVITEIEETAKAHSKQGGNGMWKTEYLANHIVSNDGYLGFPDINKRHEASPQSG